MDHHRAEYEGDVMDQRLLEELAVLSKEEQEALRGKREISSELYMSRPDTGVINSKMLLEKGKLITVRTHTRFVHFPKHSHNYVEVVYMCQGSTTHRINGEEVVLSKGELLFLNQNAMQEIMPAGEKDIAVNLIILPEFFDQALRMLGDEKNLVRDFIIGCLNRSDSDVSFLHFHVTDVLPIQNLVENLIWTLHNKQQNDRQLNQTTMGLLFMQLINHVDKLKTGANALDHEILAKVYQFVEEHYQDGELSELANTLGYDLYWLSRRIKKLTGQTYTELVQQKRLQQAGFLLEKTTMSVADIGYLVGYSNTSYFYRLFKGVYGKTPREYRKKH